MQDRISQDPGRYLVTPDDGSPAFYAHLTLADNPVQQGTPLSKENLLKDQTAQQLGLQLPGATVDEALAMIQLLNSNADIFDLTNKNTFNDALEWFRQFAWYYWRKRTHSIYYTFKSRDKMVQWGSNNVVWRISGSSNRNKFTIRVMLGTSLDVINSNFRVSNVFKEKEWTVTYDSFSTTYKDEINEFMKVTKDCYAGLYVSEEADFPGWKTPVFIDYAKAQRDPYVLTMTTYKDSFKVYCRNSTEGVAYYSNYATHEGISDWVTISDPNVNAYPKSGIISNTEWDYLGVPFSRIKSKLPNITYGTYTGTGTSPVLTANFPISLVIVTDTVEFYNHNAKKVWIYTKTDNEMQLSDNDKTATLSNVGTEFDVVYNYCIIG